MNPNRASILKMRQRIGVRDWGPQDRGPESTSSGPRNVGDARAIGRVADKTLGTGHKVEGGSCSVGVTGRGVNSGTPRQRCLPREGEWDS